MTASGQKTQRNLIKVLNSAIEVQSYR